MRSSIHSTVERFRQTYWRWISQYRETVWNITHPDRVKCGITGHSMFLDTVDTRSVALWRTRGNVNGCSLRLWQHILNLRPWTVIIDVGANHGEMLLNVRVPPDAVVFAFEPNPRLAGLLRRSFTANGLPFKVVEAAAGAAAGEVTLNVSSNWSGKSSILAMDENAGSTPVRVAQVSLAEFLAEQGFPPAPGSLAMKIDVEGYEPDVLRGLLKTIGHWSDVMIMIEMLYLPEEARAEFERHFYIGVLGPNEKLVFLAPGQYTDHQDVVLIRKG